MRKTKKFWVYRGIPIFFYFYFFLLLFLIQNRDCVYSLEPPQRGSKKVQVGKDQEKAQSERDSHSKNRGGKKTN